MGVNFYRNSEACVLVFDLTSEESFNNIESWRIHFLNLLNPPDGDKYPFILLGNKNDRERDIKINKDKIDNYCKEHNNMPYFSTSAKDGLNLDEAFNKVSDMAFERFTKNELNIVLPDTKYLKYKKEQPKKKKCCK